jgi:hypothetical protein
MKDLCITMCFDFGENAVKEARFYETWETEFCEILGIDLIAMGDAMNPKQALRDGLIECNGRREWVLTDQGYSRVSSVFNRFKLHLDNCKPCRSAVEPFFGDHGQPQNLVFRVRLQVGVVDVDNVNNYVEVGEIVAPVIGQRDGMTFEHAVQQGLFRRLDKDDSDWLLTEKGLVEAMRSMQNFLDIDAAVRHASRRDPILSQTADSN